MNLREFTAEAKYYFATAKDWVRKHPLISGGVAIAVLSFALGAYAFAAVTCKGNVPGTLTCVEDGSGPVVPPVIPPVGDFAGCPANAMKVRDAWGKLTIYTSEYGTFHDQILSVQIKVPANWSGQKVGSWVEYQDGGVMREWSLSTNACDFTNTVKTGVGNARGFSNLGFTVRYKNGVPSGSYAGLVPGQTYYINARNRFQDGSVSCGGSCNMRGAVPQ